MGHQTTIDLPQGKFNGAHDFIVQQATFISGDHSGDHRSVDLLSRNILPGVEFDSSERYPPPFCHPGTRLDISGKVTLWMRDPARIHRIAWLHGPAGVGKSAVIQTLAESESDSQTSILGATVFFSRPAERDDPLRLFTTIAYQLAVKYQPYRKYVVELLAGDPRVVNKSMVEQFKWLITKPFFEQRLLHGETILVALDGLDECKGESAQREIISIITRFSLRHPHTPLIWIIASRPEPHISSAFSCPDAQMSYLELDMPINSNQACSDVERFLRDKFAEIKGNYPTSFSPSVQQWPTETQFVKIAARSSGLFIFANTVIRFVEDAEYSNPVAQLQKIMDILDILLVPGSQENPFAALDTLYTQVLSEIPSRLLPIVRKHLSTLVHFRSSSWKSTFFFNCNVLGINQAEAYGALRKLHSVLKIPSPEECLEVFHASLIDYLTSPSRSGHFWIDPLEAERMMISAGVRTLLEAHNSTESDVRVSNIHTSWPLGRAEVLQLNLFSDALSNVMHAPLEHLEHLEQLRYFFRDIDYANLSAVPRSFTAISTLSLFCQSPLFPQLKEWGVLVTTPIHSLDLSSISLNEATYIISDKLNPAPGRGDLAWVPARQRCTLGPLFHACPRAFAVNVWYAEATALRNEPGWRAHINRRLTRMKGLRPSYPVYLLGKGHKTCALITLDDSDRLWIYALPYRRP